MSHEFGHISVAGIENGADMRGGDAFVTSRGNVGLSILLKMELAALPQSAGEGASQGCANALMVIAGDGERGVHTSIQEALDKGRPVLSRFRNAGRDPQYNTLSCFCFNAYSHENGAIGYPVVEPGLDVGRIKEKVGDQRQWAGAPLLKELVKLSSALAHVSR